METEINKAINILNKGGIIIYPTDTAFGIGCRIDREDAIRRLFNIRKRPKEKAMPVLVSNIGMAGDYVTAIPLQVKVSLMEKYWPGALTVVLDADLNKVPELVRGIGTTVGLRCPKFDPILRVIDIMGVPILGPSANFHGEMTPFSGSDLDPELTALVDYVMPGFCPGKKVSTVVDCTINPWKILRQGAIELDDIMQDLEPVNNSK